MTVYIRRVSREMRESIAKTKPTFRALSVPFIGCPVSLIAADFTAS